jgi:hypothetical protein
MCARALLQLMPPTPTQGSLAASRGGPFSVINAAAARDVVVVSLPPHTTLTAPLYLLHISTGECSVLVKHC